eukprot:463338-Karenia_brevis.AAC.1
MARANVFQAKNLAIISADGTNIHPRPADDFENTLKFTNRSVSFFATQLACIPHFDQPRLQQRVVPYPV